MIELSIVVPVFNRGESLRRAVDSIVSRSDLISVIIVDDGSTPEFATVADEVAAANAPAVRVVHQSNRGPAAARNRGLRCTPSRFVMFLDSDDELADTAFPAIDQHLLRRDDVGLLCGAVRVVSAGGDARVEHPAAPAGVPWAKLSGLSGSFVVRTDVARAVGGYDEALHFGENTDLILRLAEQCRTSSLTIEATEDVLSIYHQAADERRYDAKRLDAAIHLLRRGRFDLRLPSERAKLHAIAAVNAGRVGRYGLSVRHAGRAVLTEPRNGRHLGRLALSVTGPLARRHWLKS
ncbi:MAG: glycosyltransferase family 2 protein [Actinobacteria bacterium]|nr:glycosyltransferase family 2 protein [Actinomycetota bacterium]